MMYDENNAINLLFGLIQIMQMKLIDAQFYFIPYLLFYYHALFYLCCYNEIKFFIFILSCSNLTNEIKIKII